jgi:O-antigen ligase
LASCKDYLLYLIIFSVVLTPSLNMPGSLPMLRVEELLVLALLLFALTWLAAGGRLSLHFSPLQPLLFFFGAVILFSILVGAYQGLNPHLRDFMEHVKLLKYLVLFTAVASLADTKERRLKAVDFTIVTIVISALIGITQYFNFLGLNERYVPLIAPTQYRTLVGGYPSPRIVSLSANPNEYAVIAAIGVLLCVAMFLQRRRAYYLLGGGISLLGVLMTLSRSGMVFLLVSLAIFIALTFFRIAQVNSEQLKFFFAFLLLTVLFVLLFIAFAPEALVWRLMEGMNLQTSTSWLARVARWEESIVLIRESPFFGWGPAKNIDFQWAPDNEWFYLVRRYGLIGTAYLVAAFLLPAYFVYNREESHVYRHLYLAILCGSAVYMIAAVIYHSLQVMSLIMVVAALYFASTTEKKYRLRLELPRLRSIFGLCGL